MIEMNHWYPALTRDPKQMPPTKRDTAMTIDSVLDIIALTNGLECITVCSAMQKRKRKINKKVGAALNLRISDELKDSLLHLANAERRNLSQYVIIVLENHVTTPRPLKVAPLPTAVAGSSEPPARIAQQAAARGKVPPAKLAEIAESDEGWEGSDPRTLLGGTLKG